MVRRLASDVEYCLVQSEDAKKAKKITDSKILLFEEKTNEAVGYVKLVNENMTLADGAPLPPLLLPLMHVAYRTVSCTSTLATSLHLPYTTTDLLNSIFH